MELAQLVKMVAISKALEGVESNPESSQKGEDNNTVAPFVGEEVHCTGDRRAATPSESEMRIMENEIHPIEEQLQYLLSRADECQEHLMRSQDHVQNEGFAQVVSSFLRVCQPFFTYLESMARDTLPDRYPLPPYMRARLLQFSQQLCSKLEQLVLTVASFGCISLEESDPLGISHFYIGRCQLGCIRVSIFRYCRPVPLQALTSSRLHKLMRWNVEQGRGSEGGGGGEQKETGSSGTQGMEREGQVETRERKAEGNSSTEYYFLCCEDIPVVERECEAGRGQADRGESQAVRRMWSIGQWAQTYPDPNTEDIYNWVLCAVPLGQFKPLVCLGEEEPSNCMATDCLLEALLSQSAPSASHHTSQTVLSTA